MATGGHVPEIDVLINLQQVRITFKSGSEITLVYGDIETKMRKVYCFISGGSTLEGPFYGKHLTVHESCGSFVLPTGKPVFRGC